MKLKNLPTMEELISFLKDNLKLIILTIILSLCLFAVGIGYTVYTNNKTEGSTSEQLTSEEQNVLIPEINETTELEEQLTPEEIDLLRKKLQETGVAFSFYLEKEPAESFNSPSLLKELLISPSMIQTIEEETNLKIEPNPELVVDVGLNPDNALLTITIGTGNEKNNKIIANEYFKIISEESDPFFENKSVFITDKPESVEKITTKEEKQAEAGITSSMSLGGLSLKRISLLTIIVIILGAIIGVGIALINSLFKKEVNEIYGFACQDEDIFLNLSNVENSSAEEKDNQIVHSIIHPAKKVKLILAEENIEENIIIKLQKENTIQLENESFSTVNFNNLVLVAKSIIDIDPKIAIDEIIFICKKNKTSKKWYTKQRKLLGNYNALIKIILV